MKDKATNEYIYKTYKWLCPKCLNYIEAKTLPLERIAIAMHKNMITCIVNELTKENSCVS